MITDKNIRKELVDTIINSMKNRDSVWQKTWANISDVEAPYNPITGTKYSGINFLALSLKQTELDSIDPRWCTFKQAVAAGYSITKGSKAAQASFYDLNVSLNDDNKEYVLKAKSIDGYISKIIDHYRIKYTAKSAEINEIANEAGQYNNPVRSYLTSLVTDLNKATGADIKISSTIVMKSYPIFNYSQLENVPELEIKPINKFVPIQRAEGILIASGAKIFHDDVDRNYYNRLRHEIHLTPKESFKSPEAYYSTALHEIGHWTKGDGIPRNFKVDGKIDTNHLTYAREELRAELASIFISSDLKLELDIQNHSAYLGHYLEILNNDYTEFFSAVSDAQKISNHVINFEKRLDLESIEAKELQIKNPELFNKIADYNLSQIELSTNEPTNSSPDFKIGDTYVTKWQGEIRKFEVKQIDDDILTIRDIAYGVDIVHSSESFQETINDYSCKKLDALTSHQKSDSTKAYLETFFKEKNLPFEKFTVIHNKETHLISNLAVIDYLVNSLDSENQKTVKDILAQLDFTNDELNDFLEYCAIGVVSQKAADRERSESVIQIKEDFITEKAPEANDIAVDIAINDDNDFSM